MDLSKLRTQAARLDALLSRYASDEPALASCHAELSPLVRAIERDDFQPPDRVPCARFFGEGGFEPWPDLAGAYSSFYVTLLDLGDVTIPE